MKIMRRFTTSILCILLSLMCVFTVCAANKAYNIKELRMSIKFPDEMSVVTKESEGNTLGEDTYLQAKSSEGDLLISIFMEQDEKTQEIYSYAQMTSEDLEVYKDDLEAQGFSNLRAATYGKVDFLDATKKLTENNVEIYARYSITLINGMNIFIVSQSEGDNFTTAELNLIKECLGSIKFKTANTEEKTTNVWGVLLWIAAVILILAALFIGICYLLGQNLNQKKRLAKHEKKRRENYDVLSSAEVSHRRSADSGKLSGFKTSGDYFASGFDSDSAPKSPSPSASAPAPRKNAENKFIAVLLDIKTGITTACTHIGYFFKNLQREIKKNKRKGNKAKNNRSRRREVRRGASKEYDVFRDR